MNTLAAVIDTILSVSPRDRFCVQELSAERQGLLERSVKLLRPQIGIITHIGQDHYSAFRSLESTAAEKRKLVELLPDCGTAILNADDVLVFEMRKQTKAQVITYGLSKDATIRGENVSCEWPQRMSLDVYLADTRFRVQTRLLGEHWAHAVLAAISACIASGVSPRKAVEAVENYEPTPYRMCPHKTSDGVTFISDNCKAPLWTVPADIDFMRKARAQRKIIVIGSISDTPKSFYNRNKAVIRMANGVADKLIFVGEHAYSALRTQTSADDNRISAFGTISQLNSFLNGYLKSGDLVLLKGTEYTDHLQRIILSRVESIDCWKNNCDKKRFCPDCRHLHIKNEVKTGI